MSISDELGPSIFCRKVEKALPMMENIDENVVYFPQSKHFDFDIVIYEVFFPICTLTWRANNYVSLQGKDINRRNGSTDY